MPTKNYSINRYFITLKGTNRHDLIGANNAKGAWGKFKARFHGPLKPCRSDYTVRRIGQDNNAN